MRTQRPRARAAWFLAVAIGACAPIAPLPTQPLTPALASAEFTPAALRAMIARDSAAATVGALTGDGGEGNDFLSVGDAISRGDQAWLDLVPLLAPGADAATAEILTMAISIALPHNPAGVLRLVNADRPVADICVNRMIEPSPEDTAAYKASAIAAVTALRDPALTALKRDCLAALRR